MRARLAGCACVRPLSFTVRSPRMTQAQQQVRATAVSFAILCAMYIAIAGLLANSFWLGSWSLLFKDLGRFGLGFWGEPWGAGAVEWCYERGVISLLRPQPKGSHGSGLHRGFVRAVEGSHPCVLPFHETTASATVRFLVTWHGRKCAAGAWILDVRVLPL